MTTLYVAGVAMTKFGPIPGSSVRSLTAEAVAACLNDAGATAADVEAARQQAATVRERGEWARERARFVD